MRHDVMTHKRWFLTRSKLLDATTSKLTNVWPLHSEFKMSPDRVLRKHLQIYIPVSVFVYRLPLGFCPQSILLTNEEICVCLFMTNTQVIALTETGQTRKTHRTMYTCKLSPEAYPNLEEKEWGSKEMERHCKCHVISVCQLGGINYGFF